MSSLPGTVIAAKIVPGDSLSTYATHDAIYGRGGIMTVATTGGRNAIIAARLVEGMQVYVQSVGYTYRLKAGYSVPTTVNDWEILSETYNLARTPVPAGSYNILPTDYLVAKIGITPGGDTITLPNPSTLTIGREFIITDETGTANANNITLDSIAGLISGRSTFVMNNDFGSVTVYTNGANWFVI